MAAIRVGVVGARRHAQGIGEFVARDLAACGAEVSAIVGTRTDTVEAARENLQNRYGLITRGYLSVEEMLAAELLDAVAICSPHQFHRPQLEAGVQRGMHVLCEKPLVFEEGRNSADDARRIVEQFARTRRLLMVNQQWPYTLPFFDRCWPGVRQPDRTPRKFAMLLAPSEQGAAMIPNAMPHVFSLLAALAPGGGELHNIEISQGAATLSVRFDYVHSAGRTEVAVHLEQRLHQPRPAGYALDGYGVRRTIRTTDYQMFFERMQFEQDEEFWRFVETGGDHGASDSVPLDDPLRLLIADFLRRVEFAEESDSAFPKIVDSARWLATVYDAAFLTLAQ